MVVNPRGKSVSEGAMLFKHYSVTIEFKVEWHVQYLYMMIGE